MTFAKASFYAVVRAKLGPLNANQVLGTDYILDAATPGVPLAHAAYMLATAWHETAATMLPVREAFNLGEAWRKRNLRYWPFYGRGYVQLTWPVNYQRAGRELGMGDAMVRDPDIALRPEVAAKVMRLGMTEGWFTGVTLAKCLPSHGTATRAQYMAARRIINGTDRADLIEDYAQVFERALIAGGWE